MSQLSATTSSLDVSDTLETIKKDRGLRLKNQRRLKGMTGEELAKKLTKASGTKYTVSAIYAWEKGRNLLNQDMVGHLAKILNCSPADLLGPEAIGETIGELRREVASSHMQSLTEKLGGVPQKLSSLRVESLQGACRFDIYYLPNKDCVVAIRNSESYIHYLTLSASIHGTEASVWQEIAGREDEQDATILFFDLPEGIKKAAKVGKPLIVMPIIKTCPFLLST